MTTATLEKLEKETERLETKTNDMERIYNINIVNFEKRLEIKMAATEARLNGKIDGLDKKIEGLDMKIDGVDKKTEGLTMTVTGLDKSLGAKVDSIKWFLTATIAIVSLGVAVGLGIITVMLTYGSSILKLLSQGS